MRADCRPLALGSSSSSGGHASSAHAHVHDWRPVGCSLLATEPAFLNELTASGSQAFDQDDTQQTAAGGLGVGGAAAQLCCVYCQEPCEVRVLREHRIHYPLPCCV